MRTTAPERTGLLLIDKPAGITSHDVVAIVRRALGTSRVGHAGTLDPFATGLLVVLVGRGTRLIPYLPGDPKVYDAVIQFGAETDTDDLTGEVVRTSALPISSAVDLSLVKLTGTIEQLPPAYSAKKVDGVRAYAAARRGATLDLAPATVVVHSWDVRSRSESELHAQIVCDGGTYIRALARDLGRLAGSAAHLTSLRRVSSGGFDVANALTVDQLRAGEVSLRPLGDAIADMPRHCVSAEERARVVHGNPIPATDGATRVALVDDEQTLIAVAERTGDRFQPSLVLVDA